METDPKVRIAISGGGLAGATLANALLQHAHLSVQIYESAPEFSERGAAVGLSINAQRALSEISSSARGALDNARAVVQNSSRIMIGSGPDAGQLVFDLQGIGDSTLVVHRAAFLKELLKPLRPEIMHVNKKLVHINKDSETGELTLHFEDGTEEKADAVIGADGIHGFVRKHILGPDDEAVDPVFSGWWDCRNLVSMDQAKKILGEELFKDSRQYGWIGDGGFLLHDVLDGGDTVQCIICCYTDEKWPNDQWKKPLSREKLVTGLKAWQDGPISNGMIELMLDQPNPQMFALWEHRNARTYSDGCVCMMGDAAHAMTPWQGSGAGMAIEDAMILGTLLGDINHRTQLETAFQAYDLVRRPRTQRVVESSHGTGTIMSGKAAGVGIDVQKLLEALPSRWTFITEMNMYNHQQEALKEGRKLRTNSKHSR